MNDAANGDRSPPRRLIIVRHGKAASQPPGGGPDRARPLTERGEADARAAARRLLNAGIQVDYIVSSPAQRTQGTARIMAQVLRHAPEFIDYAPDVYNAPVDRLLDVLAGCEPSIRRLMLVGHNPGLSELADRLVAEPLPGLPTSGIVAIDLPAEDWSDLGHGRGTLAYRDIG